ncbi:hypothetical protein TVAGG3_0589930 [Trichomonas vaginalis G3]|nr:hypothetical protein TVAGG3_0589930 [Trichomonas vaginalis G3]KAI5523176.1 hypothetical protein TVAGG3_0589930 [Trichomonas vaginalis G3]
MSSDHEIALLRKQKNTAIENCDFQQAKSIDLQIQKLLDAKNQQNNQANLTKALLTYNIEKENIKIQASEMYNEYYNQVYKAKSRFQKRRNLLQQSHANALAKLAEEYAKELEVETTRAIPEADTRKNQAQIRARNQEYDVADALFKESQQIRQQILQSRQDAVHKKYNELRTALEAKNKSEDDLCDKKEKQVFTEIQTNYNNEIDKLDKTLQARSLRLNVPRGEDEAEMFRPLFTEDEIKEIQPLSPVLRTPLSPKTSPLSPKLQSPRPTSRVSQNSTPRANRTTPTRSTN